MEETSLKRWTRSGILQFTWSPYETFEDLVLSPQLRESLKVRLENFMRAEADFQALRLPWRYGIFFFGPPGSGKTAAGRALAQLLRWNHLTIPAHEILDSHLFERALAEAVATPRQVILLEDVDKMARSMEPEVFFTLLDHAMERASGSFWIATSRRPEDAPKTQLLRPGRFDEAIRLEAPPFLLRQELMKQLLHIQEPETLREVAQMTEGLTYSHFEEMRQLLARMTLEKKDPAEFWSILKSYVEDQLIAGDRWGGLSDSTTELEERVQQIDARVLSAALDMTDVFRRLIEKVIGDAASVSHEGDSSPTS